MTRVPLSDLRAAFANPSAYVKNFKPGVQSGWPSKYGMFLHAIGVFHRSGALVEAQDYLEEKLKKFKTFSDLPDYARKLDRYAREFRRQGNSLVRYRDNVTIFNPSGSGSLAVTGQASRVDLVRGGGYGVWMFLRDVPDWAQDPKMPLLHATYVESFNVSLRDVSVGVYDFDRGAYETRRYSAAEITKAQRTMNELLKALQSRLAKK
jgi:hypothetical protein